MLFLIYATLTHVRAYDKMKVEIFEVKVQMDNLNPELALEGSALLEKKYLSKKDYVFFSLAQFASSAITGLVQGYLLFFYTVCVGINAQAVGTMFLVSKIFDGANDPFMGAIVDKTRSKWGKMRPYLIFGAIPWSLVTLSLFIPVTGFSMTGKIVYMYITYLLWAVFGTIVIVPLSGIPAVASPNNQERGKLISISRILGSIGEQSALVLISVGLLISKNYTNVYLITAIIIGALAPVLMLLGAFSIKERLEPTTETPKLLDGFKYLFKNKPFLILICANLLTFFRNLVSAAIIYVVTYIFSNGSLQIVFALPGAVASMIGMLFAPKLNRMMDSKKLFIFATVWHSVALVIVYAVYMLGLNHWVAVAVFMFIAMLPVGVLNVVPHLMAADTLDYWEDKTGQRCEGMTFSLMNLRSSVSSGFKDYTLSFLLAFFMFAQPVGYLNDHSPEQSDFTKTGILLIFTLIPAICNLVSIVPMIFYPLSGKKMEEIQTRLAITREKAFLDANKEELLEEASIAIEEATVVESEGN